MNLIKLIKSINSKNNLFICNVTNPFFAKILLDKCKEPNGFKVRKKVIDKDSIEYPGGLLDDKTTFWKIYCTPKAKEKTIKYFCHKKHFIVVAHDKYEKFIDQFIKVVTPCEEVIKDIIKDQIISKTNDKNIIDYLLNMIDCDVMSIISTLNKDTTLDQIKDIHKNHEIISYIKNLLVKKEKIKKIIENRFDDVCNALQDKLLKQNNLTNDQIYMLTIIDLYFKGSSPENIVNKVYNFIVKF